MITWSSFAQIFQDGRWEKRLRRTAKLKWNIKNKSTCINPILLGTKSQSDIIYVEFEADIFAWHSSFSFLIFHPTFLNDIHLCYCLSFLPIFYTSFFSYVWPFWLSYNFPYPSLICTSKNFFTYFFSISTFSVHFIFLLSFLLTFFFYTLFLSLISYINP